MKKLLLLAAAALTSFSLCANAVLPLVTELKPAEATFTKSKISFAQPDARMIQGAPVAKMFTLANGNTDRRLTPSRSAHGTVMPFSYAGSPYSLDAFESLGQDPNKITIGKGTRVYLAFTMLPDDVKALAGNSVTQVTLVSPASNDIPTNPIPEVEFFISSFNDEFGAAYDYKQKMNLGSEAFAEVNVPLTKPYVIPSDKNYVLFGYSFIVPEGENYWLPFDFIQAPSQLAGLITATNDEELVNNIGETSPASWATFTSACGSLCMYLTLEGDNLPQDALSALTFDVEGYTKPGENSELYILYDNKGANDIEEVGITAKVNDGQEAKYNGIVVDYRTGEPAPTKPGGRGVAIFRIPVPADVEGTANIAFTIDRVNDTQKALISSSYEILSYNKGYDRKIVFEDATGNWCGWCPSGMVMLDYIKEKYPEALLIGVHGSQSATTRDPMAVTAYSNALNELIQGYPSVLVNRIDSYSPGGASETALKAAADEYMEDLTSYPSYGNITFTSSKKTSASLNVSATIKFSVSLKQPHSVSFVTIQDEVGPYDQTNYYATGYPGHDVPLGDWNNAGSPVNMIYNDVARGFKQGAAFAEAVEKDKEYTFSSTVSYSKVDAAKPHRVAALLINNATGEIVNASVMECLEGDSAGVEDVIAGSGDADITIGAGSISVTGATTVAVYSLDGRKVADGNATGLAAGIYIVVADGHSTKVAVY